MLGNPFERLKWITAAQIGAIHVGVEATGLRSPLNPILGETLTSTTERGSTLYMEQTSHYPPISHFHMIGPESLPFEIYGHVEFCMALKGLATSATFSTPGIVRLKLPDQTIIEMSTKQVNVGGLLYKEKLFNVSESMTIQDVTNGINAEVIFDSAAKSRVGYWTSFVKGNEKLNADGVLDNRSDLIEVKLTDDADYMIGLGTGSYLESISFDNRPFWSIEDKHMVSKWVAPPAE